MVFESKFMLPWSFSEEAAAEKYMPQLQHNMWVVAARSAVLSVITGGGKWVEIKTHADPLYQYLIVTAERKFWRCVESGEPPIWAQRCLPEKNRLTAADAARVEEAFRARVAILTPLAIDAVDAPSTSEASGRPGRHRRWISASQIGKVCHKRRSPRSSI